MLIFGRREICQRMRHEQKPAKRRAPRRPSFLRGSSLLRQHKETNPSRKKDRAWVWRDAEMDGGRWWNSRTKFWFAISVRGRKVKEDNHRDGKASVELFPVQPRPVGEVYSCE